MTTGIPTAPREVFEGIIAGVDYIFVPAAGCPEELRSRLVDFLQEGEFPERMRKINTGTSRGIFFMDLGEEYPALVAKRSNWKPRADQPARTDIQSPQREVHMNRVLQGILREAGENITPPEGFNSVSIKMEVPVGVLVNRRTAERYSVYLWEGGYDAGEMLSNIEPPFEGVLNFNPREWRDYIAIMYVLEELKKLFVQHRIRLNDYNVHQVLYYVDEVRGQLNLVLIDTEKTFLS